MTTLKFDREQLGRIVRYAWIEWAKQQPDPKSSWLTPWKSLPEEMKEVDRQIGEAVAEFVLQDQVIYREMLAEIEKCIASHEATQSVVYHGSRVERIKHLLGNYRQAAAAANQNLLDFKQDVQTWMRAIALLVDSAANAATHTEKNARLRGVVDLVESAIQRLRDNFRHFSDSWWQNPDIFRSDYPVKRYVERIRELEAKLAELEKTEDKPQQAQEFDEIPL
jgi:hypothetical protein